MVNNSTKRALVSSTLAILMCVSMLIGTTFAWFTDTASTAVNAIHSGTLTVDIVKEDGETSIQDQGISFVNVEGKSDILWEPGATFTTPVFKIKSTGTLALKYKLVLNGIDGDNDLLDVIRFSVVGENGTEVNLDEFEGHLTHEAPLSEALYIRATMDKAAGNDYQGKTLEGLGITVYATQDTVEKDSTGNEYDQNATYDGFSGITVTSAAELTEAIRSAEDGETIRLAAAIDSSSAIKISKNLTIDLNGFTLSGTAANTLVLNAGANVTLTDSSDGATGVIANTYSGSANAATIDLQGSNATFTLKSGTVKTNTKDNLYTVAISNSKKTACTVNILGGTVTCAEGHEKSRAITASNGMVLNLYGGTVSGGLYALDVYAGSVSNIIGGTLFANALDGRTDEYGTSYAIHAKGEATITIGSADATTTPNVKGIKFESSGVKTELPTITLIKGEITNPIYSMEAKYNYTLFRLNITAGAPVTFCDDTAHFFLADDLQMVEDGGVFKVTAK